MVGTGWKASGLFVQARQRNANLLDARRRNQRPAIDDAGKQYSARVGQRAKLRNPGGMENPMRLNARALSAAVFATLLFYSAAGCKKKVPAPPPPPPPTAS